MITELPAAAAAYFRAANAGDTDAVVACFAPGAVIRDEGRDISGPEAIATWNETASKAVGAHCDVETVEATPHGVDARAKVSGTFPGSPVHLIFHFTIGETGIARLEVTP